jgi:hypothetical protein
MHVSSPKIISHSLRSLPVEGEYCLSINDRLMQGEIAPGVSAKIRAALFFVEQSPYPFGIADNGLGAPLTKTLGHLVRHPSLLYLTLISSENERRIPQRAPQGESRNNLETRFI